ncbi:hypothetical protein [Sphingomicrobium arenosum]|uniref:hypothetical protein n=1 Tax=Sphingomicrobium arenosum TaxID=2233861 RepID=UPI00223F7569|nr:hypothetical protein [Sphingomicrobium arenosum]
MVSISVIDRVGTTELPGFSWDWKGVDRCTARLLIEERLRTETERAARDIPASRFLLELSGGLDGFTDQLAERAFAAFTAGKLLLIVNDAQVTDLDEEIPLHTANEAVFFKLVPLQGG